MKVRVLLALVFNTAIAFVVYWLGAGAGIAWLTFLLFWMFAGLAEMSDRLWQIQGGLDTILKKFEQN
jgi:hypothetical protein